MAHPRRDLSPALFRGRELTHWLTMIFLLIVLGMMIFRAREAGTSQWPAEDRQASQQDENRVAAGSQEPAQSVPAGTSAASAVGPTDQDPDEADAAREQFEAISDRQPLAPEEMPAYWRLMRWSNNQSFGQMQRRANRDVLYTQLWEQPEKYRGALIELRLHLQRGLSHAAPENSAGVKTVYEAWGWTDESKSLPYLVVFSELPPQMPLGPDIRENVTFVGYFLKTMAYEASDKPRAAPLLIGRVRWQTSRAGGSSAADQRGLFWWTLLGGGLVLLVGVGVWIYRRRVARAATLHPTTFVGEDGYKDWLRDVQESPPDDASERS
jgi:hypothetical protein